MCGILACTYPVEDKLFKSALDRLTHRGPDDWGTYYDNHVSLGHRRLSILDLSENGKQPFQFNDRYLITYNGEIYNFLEIREELKSKGVTFRTETDTEVIIAAYLEWGEKCLYKFNGMWAFVIYDTLSKEAFISRDRFGVKPLYYSFNERGLILASEMKAITPFLDDVKASSHFQWCTSNIMEYEATDKTLVEGIQRFPAGAYTKFQIGDSSLNPTIFWNTLEHTEKVPEKYDQQVERFYELFSDAVKIRMRADVPVGTSLSGGVDSTSVASMMTHIGNTDHSSRISGDWQHAFVATFPGVFFDERPLAEKVSKHLGINASFMDVDPVSGLDNLSEYLYKFEDIYLTSPVPMMQIYRQFRNNNVFVSIDGHGADEMMAGYGESIFQAFKDAGYNFKKIKNILNTYYGLRGTTGDQIKIKKGFFNDIRHIARGLGGGSYFIKYYLKHLFTAPKKNDPTEGYLDAYNTHLYQMYHKTILPTLLRNYDRYSMAAGIEVRMPFLDYRLASYVFSLPTEAKIRNGYTKSILRSSMDQHCPKDILWRKAKIGFNTPVIDWMRGPWKTYMKDTLESSDFKTCDLINAEELSHDINHIIESPNPQYEQGEKVWLAFSTYLWQKSFLNKI